MIVAIHQPQYLPWLPYFDKADQADVFVYLDTVQYQKNGVQNRNQVLTAQGPKWLTLPVHASLAHSIRETRLADPRAAVTHARTIAQEYRRALFRAWFAEGLQPILGQSWETLAEINYATSEWMMEKLGIATRRVRASELGVSGAGEDLVLAICRELGATIYLSGTGARAYQSVENFQANGIELRYQAYRNQPYPQCHDTEFVPDLSALDLLLNLGPDARATLLAGRTLPETAPQS